MRAALVFTAALVLFFAGLTCLIRWAEDSWATAIFVTGVTALVVVALAVLIVGTIWASGIPL